MSNTAMEKAVAQLVLHHPFYAQMVMTGQLKVDETIPTAATDGVDIFYNPEFMGKLNIKESVFVLAHEAEHIVRLHSFRRSGRDPKLWNIAADHVINVDLQEAGFTLPRKEIIEVYGDSKYDGWTTEQVYRELEKNPPQPKGQGSEYGDMADDVKQPKGGPQQQAEAKSKAMTRIHKAAHAAKQQGNLPAHMQDLLDDLLEPKVSWQDVLQQFVAAVARDDYSWSRLNRRMRHRGLRLPTLYSEQVGDLVFIIDTSGSCWDEIPQFVSECASVAEEVSPTAMHLIWNDTRVQRHDELDDPNAAEECFHNIERGGGTDLTTAFDYIEEKGIEAECIVALTDLMTPFPSTPPDVPVLWVTTMPGSAPFGEVIEMDVGA